MFGFAFVSSSHCLKFHCQQSTGMQLMRLWGAGWVHLRGTSHDAEPEVRAPSLLSQYHSAPISHDSPKSWCILGSLAHSGELGMSLECLLAGGTSLALAAVSLHPS